MSRRRRQAQYCNQEIGRHGQLVDVCERSPILKLPAVRRHFDKCIEMRLSHGYLTAEPQSFDHLQARISPHGDSHWVQYGMGENALFQLEQVAGTRSNHHQLAYGGQHPQEFSRWGRSEDDDRIVDRGIENRKIEGICHRIVDVFRSSSSRPNGVLWRCRRLQPNVAESS
jgi:hypothetical protein